jgi:hypothetical protein
MKTRGIYNGNVKQRRINELKEGGRRKRERERKRILKNGRKMEAVWNRGINRMKEER